ncbi:MAG: DUF4388 domain-containing protein [Thermoanaerobaculaceae bacterium]
MALQGSLSDLALPDVIQLVSVSGKTGVFTLSGDSGLVGKIFLRDGQIVDAYVGELRGENAVYEMAIWQRGQFIFTPQVETDQVTITKSNASLMMEAARRLDEWRVLQKRIPSLDLIPYFMPREPGHDQVTLSPQEWVLVTKIDGEKSIRELEQVTKLSAFDLCKTLFGLITSGLIGLRAPGEQAPQARPAGPSATTLLALTENIRKVAEEIVGPGGAITVEKQYRLARTEIERGNGMAAVQGMVDKLARAISLLKGNEEADEFLRRVRPLVEL